VLVRVTPRLDMSVVRVGATVREAREVATAEDARGSVAVGSARAAVAGWADFVAATGDVALAFVAWECTSSAEATADHPSVPSSVIPASTAGTTNRRPATGLFMEVSLGRSPTHRRDLEPSRCTCDAARGDPANERGLGSTVRPPSAPASADARTSVIEINE
jgi:hypothetical protein